MAQLQTSVNKNAPFRKKNGSSVLTKAERHHSPENYSSLGPLQDHLFNEPALDYI